MSGPESESRDSDVSSSDEVKIAVPHRFIGPTAGGYAICLRAGCDLLRDNLVHLLPAEGSSETLFLVGEDAAPDECDECGHLPISHGAARGCEFCSCRVGEAVRPPESLPPVSLNPLPAYAVTYAVVGGQQYTIHIPGDASVEVVDGEMVIHHPARQTLGIVSIRTQPTLTQREETHDAAHDHRQG